MTRRYALLLLVLLPLTGCFKTFELDKTWAPLVKISERPDMLAKNTVSTTIGSTIYVGNIDQWFERNPLGSPQFIGLMKHEQEHSKRQFKKGVFTWLAKYLSDVEFMWSEEQRGYYLAFTTPGYRYDPRQRARNMSNYKNAVGKRMVSYEDALQWIYDVRAGRWKPKD
jgi:hypothetical protein